MGRAATLICVSLFAVTVAAALLAMFLPIPATNGCPNGGVDTAWDAAVDRRASFAIVSALAWLATVGAAGIGIIFNRSGVRLSMVWLLVGSVTVLPILVFFAWFTANPCGLS